MARPSISSSPAPALWRVALPWLAFAALTTAGCSEFVKPTLPGDTSYRVRSLSLTSDAGPDVELSLPLTILKKTLAVRPDAFLLPGQPYNPYRLAADARRIVVFWQSHGYFDAAIADKRVDIDEAEGTVDIAWKVHEGPLFTIRDVRLQGAPAGWERRLSERISFKAGDPTIMHDYRWVRHAMADDLRRAGWLRAEVYSRTFVDRQAKRVDWVYFVDPGPRSVVGQLRVAGNVDVPVEQILARVGLTPGEPLDFNMIDKREQDLLDTGAFTTARLYADYGTEFVTEAVPADTWIPPDTGGVMKDAQIAPDGSYIPRAGLKREIDLTVTVVEAPDVQGRLGAGVNIDLERIDPFASGRLELRNALGALHHLVAEGSVGYGLGWRGDPDEPEGLYGSALLRYIHPGFIGRLVDLRATLSIDESLYPGFHWRTARAGLGLHSALGRHVFFDLEPRLRFDTPVGVGTIAQPFLDDNELAAPADSLNGELALSLIWDARDDGVEPLSGHLVALRGAWAPGGALGDTPWLRAELDLRWIINLGRDLGLGLRALGGWVFALDPEAGVPIGARLFGGGAYGLRGFGTRRLSPYAQACEGGDCRSIPVGAASLVEGSVELRWLPWRQQQGAVAFVDFGGAGLAADPFEEGVSVAAGLGLRVRLWHFPLGLDLAYRVTDVGAYSGLDRFFAFLRFGEAF